MQSTLLLGTMLLALQDSSTSTPPVKQTPPDARIDHLESVKGPLCFSKDGSLAAAILADTAEVVLIDVAAKKKLRTLTGLKRINRKGPIVPYVIPVLVFSPDSRFLVGGLTTSSDKGSGPHLIWDVRTGKSVAQYRAFNGETIELAFTSDGKALVSSGTDRLGGWSADAIKVWAWDPDHPGISKPPLWELTLNHRGIALGSGDRTIIGNPSEKGYEIRHFGTGALLQTVDTPLPPDHSTWSGGQCTQFSPDGKLLAIGSATLRDDKTDPADPPGLLRLWNADDTSLRREFLFGRTVWHVSFTPDSKRVAATSKIDISGEQCRISVFDVDSGERLRQIEGDFSDAVVTPDGKWIASAGTNAILFWKMPP